MKFHRGKSLRDRYKGKPWYGDRPGRKHKEWGRDDWDDDDDDRDDDDRERYFKRESLRLIPIIAISKDLQTVAVTIAMTTMMTMTANLGEVLCPLCNKAVRVILVPSAIRWGVRSATSGHVAVSIQ